MRVRHGVRAVIGDLPLLGLVLALTLFGVAMIYSAGQVDVPDPTTTDAWKHQLVWLGLSVAALTVVV